MENSLELKKWILKQSEKSLVSISEISWPKKLGLTCYDFSAEVTVGPEKYVGHGADFDPNIALCKSVSEAFERYKVKELNFPTSNGCAAHFELQESKKRATEELIERDCFLFKFIKREPFEKISKCRLKVSLPDSSMLSNYQIHSSSDRQITVSRIHINNLGNIVGLGIGSTIESALFSSEIEVLRQWAHLIMMKNFVKRSYESINSQSVFSFDDHGDIALTPEHSSKIEELFESKVKSIYEYHLPPEEYSYLTEYSENDESSPFFGIPLYFSKATNNCAQDLFVGRTEQFLNKRRIPLKGDLNLCLHPLR